jgi:Na+/proline symporter/signal transduction histidine kinase
MLSDTTILLTIFLYVGLLFLSALWVERKAAAGKNVANNALVYSLSLAIYCTSWTYYGSVGKAVSSGMFFITVYLGPTIIFVVGWTFLRKLVRIKHAERINSIADFISARYGNSQQLAALVTVIALIGIAPYIALQFKAIISTFKLITYTEGIEASFLTSNIGPIIVVLMTVFTIIFGVRRLDPTERHQGMVMAVAIESMVKLTTFLAAGIFVTYFLFDGFSDLFNRFSQSLISIPAVKEEATGPGFSTWITHFILSASAIIFLPRQFHIAVVENSDEKHIRTAMWLFPLYMLLITIFVIPIAIGGLMMGLSADEADFFVLNLPLYFGNPGLALLIFIGGFSAATSMVMISSMTMSTMITNHLLLPLADWVKRLGFLRRNLLRARWVTVTAVILLGYLMELILGDTNTLVNMGMISFAAALQFAPAMIGGMFWRGGNKGGAILGMSSGFLIWFYTLLLPSIVRSGWPTSSFLENGPWGIGILNPEKLFGLTGLESLPHATFWTMLFNIGLYVLGSFLYKETEQEMELTEKFLGIRPFDSNQFQDDSEAKYVDIEEKREIVTNLLQAYFPKTDADDLINKTLRDVGFLGKDQMTVLELAEICDRIENILAGSIGTAIAYKTFRQAGIFNKEEKSILATAYSGILASLKLTPKELRTKIDYFKDRGDLITAHAKDLEEKIDELQFQIDKRKILEKELRRYQDELEILVNKRTAQLEATNKELESFSYSVSHDLKAPLRRINGFSQILLTDYEKSLNEDGRHLIRRISIASKRMNELIDDLLKLSQLSRGKLKRQPINLSELAVHIADELQASQPERKVEFVIRPKMVVDGDARLLQIALENLLGNAWKFTANQSDTRIEFGFREEDEIKVYFVRDNGAGFDMAYSANLFGAFQRLHQDDNFPGTGIGLATVKRIISRLGGQVWAEGFIDEGATFYFTLEEHDQQR